MKLSCLPEVAALMAAYGSTFIERRDSIPVQTIGDYYVHSRNRFNRWMRLLAEHSTSLICGVPLSNSQSAAARLHPLTNLAQQVFINEMTARIWTLLLISRDHFHGQHETEALARNLLGGYQTLRRRTAELVIHNEALPVRQRQIIQDLRQSTEFWSDLLCSDMLARFNLWSFAYHPEEAQQAFQRRIEGCLPSTGSSAWTCLLEELRLAFSSKSLSRLHLQAEDQHLLKLMLSNFPGSAGRVTLLSGVAT